MRFWGRIFRYHQLPNRSFFFHGRQFPLCARCSGILLGIVVSPLICAFGLNQKVISKILELALPKNKNGQIRAVLEEIWRCLSGICAPKLLFRRVWPTLLAPGRPVK
ncbi:MAG: DUF2085 domain-containing protein [Bacilli bacterium]|nr:DUF2085 domain-containing protein [Bacilli bacterium]